jgi:hypothetical protein
MLPTGGNGNTYIKYVEKNKVEEKTLGIAIKNRFTG